MNTTLVIKALEITGEWEMLLIDAPSKRSNIDLSHD
jgi:hypothetical protein